jgi:hypothetical protein
MGDIFFELFIVDIIGKDIALIGKHEDIKARKPMVEGADKTGLKREELDDKNDKGIGGLGIGDEGEKFVIETRLARCEIIFLAVETL